MLLESLRQPLIGLHVLVHASHHAPLLSRLQLARCEVVDTVVETALYKVGVDLLKRREDFSILGAVCGSMLLLERER